MSRITIVVVVVTLTIGALIASAAAAPASPTSDALAANISQGAYCASSVEVQFLNRINRYRRQHNKSNLRMSQTIGAAARHHSEDMADRNYTSHYTKGSGDGPDDRMRAHGYPYIGSTTWGENIFWGGASARE